MTRLIDADELLKIYANCNNFLGATLLPVSKCEGCKYYRNTKSREMCSECARGYDDLYEPEVRKEQ